MPKRKTADAKIESAVKPAEPAVTRSASSKTPSKGSTSPAATHKRTATKKAKQPSGAGTADPVDIVAAAEPVAEIVVVEEVFTETVVVAAPRRPTEEQIAALAYSYWAERGYQHGSADEDWLRAERELTSQLA